MVEKKLHQYQEILESWYPGLQEQSRTLKDIINGMPGYEQKDVPFFVWLLENPKSPIAMPGYISLFNHDCIHILLGRGLLPQDEAFVIGFTMGNNSKVRNYHCSIFKFFSLYLYPPNFKLQKRDLFAFELGFKYGRERTVRDINKIDFNEYCQLPIREVRDKMNIQRSDLIEMRKTEHGMIPDSNESKRLLDFS
ncbi:MAG: hypothetical protein COA79_09330 [Planctomycetota bacterium]|nr:MAG: hypothetical protein COA79_09330 [Planctomycetota bacterium]